MALSVTPDELCALAFAVVLQKCLERGNREVVGRGVDIDEHRPCTDPGNRPGGRKERIGRRDDAIARPDVEGHEGGEERIGARRHTDAMGAAAVGGDLGLELFDSRPQDEGLRVADLLEGGEDLGF